MLKRLEMVLGRPHVLIFDALSKCFVHQAYALPLSNDREPEMRCGADTVVGEDIAVKASRVDTKARKGKLRKQSGHVAGHEVRRRKSHEREQHHMPHA
jgi:hypothetical protein